MSSLASHTNFFGNRYTINIDDLQPGMIVEFTYRKDSVGAPETKRYTVMIVDPKFKRPQDKENFTHAVNLEIAPRAAILDLAKETGSIRVNSNLEVRKVNAEKLLVEGQPRQFYQSSIANLISGKGKGSYRTFKSSRLQSLRIIDYKFPDSVELHVTE
jgi:hypothetical protein